MCPSPAEGVTAILDDPIEEAERILREADAADLAIRATGGVAIALRCPSAVEPPLKREYHDIDFVGSGRDVRRIEAFFVDAGYVADQEFNSLHGAHRLIFYHPDPEQDRKIDVFIDEIDMCHRIDLRDRLGLDSRTLSPVDLLLSKLQVVETNRKDLIDIVAICADMEVTSGDDSGIDGDYLAELCAHDWGLWRTVTMVAERAIEAAAELGEPGARAAERLQELLRRIEERPKSRKWKMRARIGERKQWYQLPEEVD